MEPVLLTNTHDSRVESYETRKGPYAEFYAALGALREDFHRIGRFDDANAKLDELCKLLVLKVLDGRHPIGEGASRLDRKHLTALARSNHGNAGRVAAAIHDVFNEMVASFPADFEAFGPHRSLNLPVDDDEFALAIIPLLEAIPSTDMANGKRWSFDGFNEAFGHFIQDSFRNRKEDAQYMTPPEVVTAVVDIAFEDIARHLGDYPSNATLLVADPTCGVGSFLAAAYRHACSIEIGQARSLGSRLRLFGQDKVDRMVRLANVNLNIFAQAKAMVRLGNSILPSNSLDDIAGKVDLIITNPPFGATFLCAEILAQATPEQFPCLFALARAKSLPKTLDSEYILLDRETALLKPGGRLMMVVPDHVVSGGGFSEDFRLALQRRVDLVGVIDLPTETFAQAGTRTKTSVVYLRRRKEQSDQKATHVFMGTSEDLGFRVVSRSGASVKKIVGHCDLEEIVEVYRSFRAGPQSKSPIVCLRQRPSVAAVANDKLLNNRWTAGFYRTERLASLQQVEQLADEEFEVCSLQELALIDPDSSERVFADGINRCISVLHVREDGCIDFKAVAEYKPITFCMRCKPGDVLLSKINPRILRICVVPATRWTLGCSPEFAVLRCKGKLSPWALAILLRSSIVQSQIRTLTSGTSSSHNRIKDRDLCAIVVPIPKPGSQIGRRLKKLASLYERAVGNQYDSLTQIIDCFNEIENIATDKSRRTCGRDG
jgi:type I restriction-modification system DNA methylase subunit